MFEPAHPSESPQQQPVERTLQDFVFVGFNSRVIALDRYSGELVWQWKCPKGRASFVAVLLDGDRLIASVQGYTYCLNPYDGTQVWANPLKGTGVGVPSLASVNGSSDLAAAAAAILAQTQAAAGAAASPG